MPIVDGDKQHFAVVVKGTHAAGGLSAKQTVNVFHYRRTAFTSDLDYSQLNTALLAKWKAEWKANASASWTFDSIHSRCINSPLEAGLLTAVGEVGGVAGEVMPPYVAMLIKKATAIRGRSYTGRMFIPGVPESGLNNSLLTAGQLVLLQALATALTGTVTTAAGLTYNPFLFAAYLSDITVEPAVVRGADITAFTASQQITSKTSRRLKQAA